MLQIDFLVHLERPKAPGLISSFISNDRTLPD